MSDTIQHLTLPMSEEQARSLQLGDMVTVTGRVFTGRSLFHIRAIRDDVYPPIDFEQINCFFHVGPVMRQVDDGWEVVSVEPTSSIRFEKYGAAVVRKFGLRTLIGKTTMGPATADALREVGGVYLTKVGVCGNLLAPRIKRVVEVHFVEELGKTEATWILEVDRFGPFFVAIDAEGRNYFEHLANEVEAAMPAVRNSLGVPDDFAFTDVNATATGTDES